MFLCLFFVSRIIFSASLSFSLACLSIFEMVGGLTRGLYPNLIRNAFFNSSVFIGSKCPWQTSQGKLISIHWSGKDSGAKNLGQAEALEPLARLKPRLWSHEPGSSKGSGAICLGQAKVEGAKTRATHRVKGRTAGTKLRTPESNLCLTISTLECPFDALLHRDSVCINSVQSPYRTLLSSWNNLRCRAVQLLSDNFWQANNLQTLRDKKLGSQQVSHR